MTADYIDPAVVECDPFEPDEIAVSEPIQISTLVIDRIEGDVVVFEAPVSIQSLIPYLAQEGHVLTIERAGSFVLIRIDEEKTAECKAASEKRTEELKGGYMQSIDDIPRRARLDFNTPAELAIRKAIDTVEEAGAHQLLTEAVILLDQAREKVADFVDEQAIDGARGG